MSDAIIIAIWILAGYGTYKEGVENGSEESFAMRCICIIYGPISAALVGMFHLMEFVSSIRIKIYRKK